MRKGRSQRKARGSLPPLSQKRQPSAHSDAGEGSVAGNPGSQVVIGLTAPGAAADDAVEARSTDSADLMRRRPTVSTLIQGSSDAPLHPTLELLGEAERLELVREQSLELVREGLDADADAEAEAQTEPDALPPVESEERTFELVESEPPGSMASTAAAPSASIPPAGDLVVEPIADRFFSEGELVAHSGVDEDAWDDAADKVQRKSLPHVVERRARFAKYVRWAVGGAAIVCVAALGRTMIVPSAPANRVTAAPLGAAVTALEAPAAKAAPPVETHAAAAAAAPEPVETAEAPAQAAEAEPAKQDRVEAPKVDVPLNAAAPLPAEVTSDKTALQEKNDARRLLERGKAADSIAAGERSVAIDPTDGEAWLLLGAAYQDKGNHVDARRCYVACLKEGKRGPRGECSAMLR